MSDGDRLAAMASDFTAKTQLAWRPPDGWRMGHVRDVETPDEMDRVAQASADAMGRGDVILLSGELGAGKTHFARAFIRRALSDPAAEVPSPTFTLVQHYPCPGADIWHADLYRLGSPDEIVELGLDLAFDEARVLVEWPERLGPDLPAHAVLLRIEHGQATPETGRRLTLWAPGGATLAGRLADAWRAVG